MVRAVEGTYRNGKVELVEKPADIEASRVFVLFVDEENRSMSHAENARMKAVEELIAMMKHGYNLGGPPYPTRDEIYDRSNRR